MLKGFKSKKGTERGRLFTRIVLVISILKNLILNERHCSAFYQRQNAILLFPPFSGGTKFIAIIDLEMAKQNRQESENIKCCIINQNLCVHR